jgi:hypothetical protein
MEFPQLHSDIGSIDQMVPNASSERLLLIDEFGKLFFAYIRQSDNKVIVENKMNVTLRDGSKLKKVHRAWQTIGSNETISLIEATTSHGQVVFAS